MSRRSQLVLSLLALAAFAGVIAIAITADLSATISPSREPTTAHASSPTGGTSLEQARATPSATTPSDIAAFAPSATATPESATPPGNPVITRIPDGQWKRMTQTGTWRPGCPVGRKDLRRLEIDYATFDGTTNRGALVAHRDSIMDLAFILGTLYEQGFPIGRMTPVERFGGDVNRSLAANNTSAYNCRKPGQINAPVKDSPHANGRAIDINPVQNPWRDPRCDCWNPVGGKGTRTLEGPGVIRKTSPVVSLFEARGWVWQNIDVADYMHFDTGYPSRPR